MRLLRQQADGEFSLEEFFGTKIPPYAILSHTWGADKDEVTFKDIVKGRGKSKAGYKKILFCAEQAAKDGLQYFWIDTCNIDKSSSAELAEAINSMFQWYQRSAVCYVYLADVSVEGSVEDRFGVYGWESDFQESRWFTRGWTLQELLAPTSVEFFSAQGKPLGNKESLLSSIYKITKISLRALQGDPLLDFSIEERLSWAANRHTKREEDAVYSLLGLFGLHMPLIYGEGRKNAFKRLHREMASSSDGIPRAIDTKSSRSQLLPRDTDFGDLSGPPEKTTSQDERELEAAERKRIIAEYKSKEAATEAKAKKERDELVLQLGIKKEVTRRKTMELKEKEDEVKAERERVIAEYEAKTLADTEKAGAERRELLRQLKLEEARRKDMEREYATRFQRVQRRKEPDTDELEEQMSQRLIGFGFNDDQTLRQDTASYNRDAPSHQLVERILENVEHDANEEQRRDWYAEVSAVAPYRSDYTSVAVFLFYWVDKSAAYEKAEEVGRVFLSYYDFITQTVPLSVTSNAQDEFNQALRTFIERNDGSSNLLIFYYAGRCQYDDGFKFIPNRESIERSTSYDLPSINWSHTENLLRSDRISGDVLAILDAHYPFSRFNATAKSKGRFELLAPSVLGWGYELFTQALVKALIGAAASNDGHRPGSEDFSTSQLHQRILQTFPRCSLVSDGPSNSSPIRLVPLNARHVPPKLYLTLSFGFEDSSLDRESIKYLAGIVSQPFRENAPFKLTRIDWRGLRHAPVSAFNMLARAAMIVIAVVRWKKLLRQQRERGESEVTGDDSRKGNYWLERFGYNKLD